MFILRQSTATDVLIGPFVDGVDGVTTEEALSPSVQLSKNGQTAATKNDVTTPVHDNAGYYNCEFDATDTGTVGQLVAFVEGTTATHLQVRHEFQIMDTAAFDALFADGAEGPLQATTVGNTLDVSATGEAGIDWANIGSPTTAQNLSGTNIDVDQVVASVSGAVGSVTAINTTGGAIDDVVLVATTTVNSDMRGTELALLAASAPTNFGDMSITITTGLVDITQAAADKAWATTTRVLTAGTNLNDITAEDVWAVDATNQQTQGTFGQAIGDPIADTTTIYQAVATDATGDNVSVDVGNLNDVAATDIVSAGAITTLAGAIVNVDLVDTTTVNSDMRGTDSALLAANINLSAGVVESNLLQMGGVVQSGTDLKDFADEGYDPVTNKVQGVVLVDTTTVNSDMRGTDSALLASDDGSGLVEAGGTGDQLTAIDLPNQTMDITGNITGNLSGSVGSVTALATDSVNANALATDAVNEIRDALLPTQNAAFDNIEFLFVAASDHVTPVTGATTITGTRSIDGAAFVSVSGAIAEVGNGIYQFDALAADMNGGIITFRFAATGGTPGAPDDRFLTIVTGGGV